mgnify:CR=1 FL=1
MKRSARFIVVAVFVQGTFVACSRSADAAEVWWASCIPLDAERTQLQKFLEAEAELIQKSFSELQRPNSLQVSDAHAFYVGVAPQIVEAKRVAVQRGQVRRLALGHPPKTRSVVGENSCLVFSMVGDLGCLVYRIDRAISADAFEAIAALSLMTEAKSGPR